MASLSPSSKDCMADRAQANWNAIQVIYGSEDAAIPMKDQEKIFLFQWTQLLEKHTKANTQADLQD
jgi:hypothetical protein